MLTMIEDNLIAVDGICISEEDVDVLAKLCRVKDYRYEWVIIGDLSLRDALKEKNYIGMDLVDGHCWGTEKLKAILPEIVEAFDEEEDEIDWDGGI